MKFTAYIANEIKENNWLNEHLVIVVPSQRATKYIMAELARAYNKPIFSPAMITINELITKHAPLNLLDPSRLLLSLYQAYKI